MTLFLGFCLITMFSPAVWPEPTGDWKGDVISLFPMSRIVEICLHRLYASSWPSDRCGLPLPYVGCKFKFSGRRLFYLL